MKQLKGGMQQCVGEKLGHGMKVCLDLLDPWRNAPGTRRVVCADSYFALVATCIELYKHNFNFIGVIKNAAKQFPMEYLKGLELGMRGDHKSLVTFDEHKRAMLLAVLWVDRERRYFVGNSKGVDPREPQYHKRWQQVNKDDAFAPPEKVEMEIDQPKMVETYYKTCSGMDILNKQCQHDVEL